MLAIQERAVVLIEQQLQFQAFTQKLAPLAQEYQDRQLLHLMQQYMEKIT